MLHQISRKTQRRKNKTIHRLMSLPIANCRLPIDISGRRKPINDEFSVAPRAIGNRQSAISNDINLCNLWMFLFALRTAAKRECKAFVISFIIAAK